MKKYSEFWVILDQMESVTEFYLNNQQHEIHVDGNFEDVLERAFNYQLRMLRILKELRDEGEKRKFGRSDYFNEISSWHIHGKKLIEEEIEDNNEEHLYETTLKAMDIVKELTREVV